MKWDEMQILKKHRLNISAILQHFFFHENAFFNYWLWNVWMMYLLRTQEATTNFNIILWRLWSIKLKRIRVDGSHPVDSPTLMNPCFRNLITRHFSTDFCGTFFPQLVMTQAGYSLAFHFLNFVLSLNFDKLFNEILFCTRFNL